MMMHRVVNFAPNAPFQSKKFPKNRSWPSATRLSVPLILNPPLKFLATALHDTGVGEDRHKLHLVNQLNGESVYRQLFRTLGPKLINRVSRNYNVFLLDFRSDSFKVLSCMLR